MILSIGQLMDMLFVEDDKILCLRERLHGEKLTKEQRVKINHKMMVMNSNRTRIVAALDEKIEAVMAKKEPNRVLRAIKTYE